MTFLEIFNQLSAFLMFFLGVLIGVLAIWLFALRVLTRKDLSLNSAMQEKEFLQKLLQEKDQENLNLKHQMQDLRQDLSHALSQNEGLKVSLEKEQAHANEKLALLNNSQDLLKKEFENISNKIFEEKSKLAGLSLQEILKPFKENIASFEQKVQDVYVKEAKERFSLATEVKNLSELNKQISQDAANLTNALKGEAKVQGNWGEMILERILEQSGLRKNSEYFVQESLRSDSGDLYRPDVIVMLPDNKQVVIDSKVSLKAYEELFSANTDEEKQRLLKAHVESLNRHLKSLSLKNYDNLEGIVSLDFVLMFVPIEGAFLIALENDNEFFQKAFEQKILVVSPSTLIVTLKTIKNVWKYEHQNKNAIEIAQRAGKMLDKFSDMIGDLDRAFLSLETTKKHLNSAKNKLSDGNGNLIKKSQELLDLGVKSTKIEHNTQLKENK